MSDINTLVALVTPLFVQLLLYGVLLPIFFVAMRLLLARKLTLRTRKTKCFFCSGCDSNVPHFNAQHCRGFMGEFLFLLLRGLSSASYISSSEAYSTGFRYDAYLIIIWYVKDLAAAFQILLGDGMLVRAFLRLDT
jgi:hypothetical protein